MSMGGKGKKKGGGKFKGNKPGLAPRKGLKPGGIIRKQGSKRDF